MMTSGAVQLGLDLGFEGQKLPEGITGSPSLKLVVQNDPVRVLKLRGHAVCRATSFRAPHSIALADFARSRSANFWIFPVEVFGMSSKRISFGHL